LALAFILAVTASLLVAMTQLRPCGAVAAGRRCALRIRWLSWMKKRQVRAVQWVENHLKLVGAVVIACCAAPSRPCRFSAERSCLNFAKATS